MMLGSVKAGGTSKRSRAAARAKNSAEPILQAGSHVFSIGSFKARPSPASASRHREEFAAGSDPEHRHDHRPSAPRPCQPDRSTAPASPWPTDRRGRADRASARRRRPARSAADARHRRRPSRRHWCGSAAARPRSSVSLRISTARNGASSTRMPTFSTGVTRKYLPSSRFRIGGEQPHQRRPADRRAHDRTRCRRWRFACRDRRRTADSTDAPAAAPCRRGRLRVAAAAVSPSRP